MAELSSIFTTAQNIATAINGWAQTTLVIAGNASYPNISASTLVRSGAGRIAKVSIVTAGTTNGTIYDANQTGVTTSPLYTIPNTIGLVELNFPVVNGIVVEPGTGQVVSISYSAVTA